MRARSARTSADGEIRYSTPGDGGEAASRSARRNVAPLLPGRSITTIAPTELDLISHRRTGTLEAFDGSPIKALGLTASRSGPDSILDKPNTTPTQDDAVAVTT